jgi:hypothetical protein
VKCALTTKTFLPHSANGKQTELVPCFLHALQKACPEVTNGLLSAQLKLRQADSKNGEGRKNITDLSTTHRMDCGPNR